MMSLHRMDIMHLQHSKVKLHIVFVTYSKVKLRTVLSRKP